jgi:anhydro-N-acetylmuramic acid kinase
MIVAGVMSGTSADGIDVAIVDIDRSADGHATMKLLHHYSAAYPSDVRAAVLSAMDAPAIAMADVARLQTRLGQLYADAVIAARATAGVRVELIGCHGQTVYHQARAADYLGAPVACTLQLDEPAIVARKTGVPVVSDFRPADIAAGGQGAPLVPLLDYELYRSANATRVLLNVGGIANMTVVPAGAGIGAVLAFDTGPGNMVMDALMERFFGKPFDEGGRISGGGRVIGAVLDAAMRNPYFAAGPPKTCGREQFGREYVERFVAECELSCASKEDMVSTAMAITVSSIAVAFEKFVRPKTTSTVECIASGGGAKNDALMKLLAEKLGIFDVRVATSDAYGMPAAAKEAAAFALLAWKTWHREPGNVPSATGARSGVILGRVTYV